MAEPAFYRCTACSRSWSRLEPKMLARPPRACPYCGADEKSQETDASRERQYVAEVYAPMVAAIMPAPNPDDKGFYASSRAQAIIDEIKIVEAPRPEDDTRKTWRALITSGLPEGDREAFKRFDFVPCYTCGSQPGSPSLCRGCLANRQTIAELQEQRDEHLRKGAQVSELARRAAAQAAHEAAGLESRLLGLITSIEKI